MKTNFPSLEGIIRKRQNAILCVQTALTYSTLKTVIPEIRVVGQFGRKEQVHFSISFLDCLGTVGHILNLAGTKPTD